MTASLTKTLANLPPEPENSLLPAIQQLLRQSHRTIFVLDDDPTGTQTVYDTPVLTTWSKEAIDEEWSQGHRLIYILTNSRSLPESEARQLAADIGGNIRSVAESRRQSFAVISRSDSTLRGHYPAEVDALAEAIGFPDAPQIIIPYFLQGGRFTIDDVHYVADGDDLIPASETPFAQDAAFGFKNSNLVDWVIEKHAGRISRDQVSTISLDDLRASDVSLIKRQLSELRPGSICCVNAVTMRDIEVVAAGLLAAQNDGYEFVFRTAASFVQAYAGLKQQPLLKTSAMINKSAAAGLIIVGSYVPKTTAQLNRLIQERDDLTTVELEVETLLQNNSPQYLTHLQNQVTSALQSGSNVVLHTSRDLKSAATAESSLQIGNRVSNALVQIVRAIECPLRFLIAKGGITSSDIATKALGVKRAIVLGQILPGIPVWKTQSESRRPGLSYVVFPGNVGDDNALRDAYEKLR